MTSHWPATYDVTLSLMTSNWPARYLWRHTDLLGIYDVTLTCDTVLMTSHWPARYGYLWRPTDLLRMASHWPATYGVTLTCHLRRHTGLPLMGSHWPATYDVTLTCYLWRHTDLPHMTSHWPATFGVTLTCHLWRHTDLHIWCHTDLPLGVDVPEPELAWLQVELLPLLRVDRHDAMQQIQASSIINRIFSLIFLSLIQTGTRMNGTGTQSHLIHQHYSL